MFKHEIPVIYFGGKYTVKMLKYLLWICQSEADFDHEIQGVR